MRYPLHPAEVEVVRSAFPDTWEAIVLELEEIPGRGLAEKIPRMKRKELFALPEVADWTGENQPDA